MNSFDFPTSLKAEEQTEVAFASEISFSGTFRRMLSEPIGRTAFRNFARDQPVIVIAS